MQMLCVTTPIVADGARLWKGFCPASVISVLSGLVEIPAALAALQWVGSITRFQEQARVQGTANLADLPDRGE
jgi:hypothetical protein